MPLILVVDDVPAMAEQYAYDLKRLGGYETSVATGGREALERICSEPVDCVILDLEMPDVDGFEVLRQLGELDLNLPVIVYTGTGNYDRCIQATRCAFSASGWIPIARSSARALPCRNSARRSRASLRSRAPY
jgi:CheY-like chemotaxis protein